MPARTHDHDPLSDRHFGRCTGDAGTQSGAPVRVPARGRSIKRAFDLFLGVPGLILAAPLIALLALAIRAKTGGPAFFTQQRIGRGGCKFSMIKIRTMAVGSEADLRAHLNENPGLREQWVARFKLQPDPRLISGLGPFLRSYSLDELPQLWNVIRGDMSLVGPRPFPEYHVARFPPEFRRLRQQVRPGITGLWQVTVRSGDLESQEFYDSYYIRNWSVWSDMCILARTVKPVLTGRDAW